MNSSPFWFNPDRYDYWSIYEAIKKYYPIGIQPKRHQHNSLFDHYPGYIAMNQFINDNIIKQKNYRERLGKFKLHLREEVKKPVQDNGRDALVPSFSALVQLQSIKEQDRIFLKELHFSVSLIGPFFTIFGMDRTLLNLSGKFPMAVGSEQEPVYIFDATHAITVSPFEEYEQVFTMVEQKISTWFSGYRFIPYYINKMYFEGLRLQNTDLLPTPIYRLLFNDMLNINEPERGYDAYGSDSWRI